MDSLIRLFKAVLVETKRKKKPSKYLLEKTVPKGFIYAPEVLYNYSEAELIQLIKVIEKELGMTAEEMNSSFHKSWDKIRKADIMQLVMEQAIHYLTTYGFEALGIYNENSVYIPREQLDINFDIDNIPLTVIKGYTKKEIKEKLLVLLGGVALKEDTMNDVLDIINTVGIEENEIDKIKNKEVRVALYDEFNLFPDNPIEFLRYAVYRATGNTLLIKSDAVLDKIKSCDDKYILTLFNKYKRKHGLEKLASIFYRFKPIFLAFKSNTPQTINRIRKLAIIFHKPMGEDYLNTITAQIKRGKIIKGSILTTELSEKNIFRKIRLAYALKFRTKDVSSILYRLRNGKGYSKDFDFEYKSRAKRVLDIVIESIVSDVKKNVNGKYIYIPNNITYTLPATEKQFTGDFPSGTYISIPNDMIAGIHWENVKGHCIDLDLSMINPNTKIGWDGGYRTEERSILFSGDITDASNGASELFYVKRQTSGDYIMFVNYYNYDESIDVPFKILVAKEQVSNMKENYMVNPDNVIAVAKTNINQKQKILGLLTTTTNECRFYFAECFMGCSITAHNSPHVDNSRKYLFDFYKNTISLNDVLVKAGARLAKNIEDCDIDLSPESLEKDTIIKLISKKS